MSATRGMLGIAVVAGVLGGCGADGAAPADGPDASLDASVDTCQEPCAPQFNGGCFGSRGSCGQTSFFEVEVVVNGTALVDLGCLSLIQTCEVRVSGVASEAFTLVNGSWQPSAFRIAVFQYGVEADAGNISFRVDIFDGNLVRLGQGTVNGAVQNSVRQSVTVSVAPDGAAFARCTPP